jgi:hypothetical protein
LTFVLFVHLGKLGDFPDRDQVGDRSPSDSVLKSMCQHHTAEKSDEHRRAAYLFGENFSHLANGQLVSGIRNLADISYASR